MRRTELDERISISDMGITIFWYESSSVSCHRLMTMDRAGKKHAPSVVIVS